MSRLLRWTAMLALLVAMAAVAALSWRSRRGRPLHPARFAVATRGELESQVLLTGKIDPLRKVVVKSRVPGRVARVFVNEGDRVRAGEALALIESSELERQAAQLRGALANAQAQLPGIAQQQAGPRRGLADGLDDAEAQLRAAGRSLDSMLSLFAAGDNAPVDRAQAESCLNQLRAQLDRARAELAGVKAGAARQELQMQLLAGARGQLQRLIDSAAATRAAMQQLAITAPISGTVIKCTLLPGDLVSGGANPLGGGQEIAVIADTSRMVVRALVPEVDVTRLRENQETTVRLDALRDEKFAGSIARIAAAAAEARGPLAQVNPNEPVWFAVEVKLHRSDSRLRTGMTASVDVAMARERNALLLPREAVFEEKSQWYAWRVVDSAIARRAQSARGRPVRHRDGRIIEPAAVKTEKALVHLGAQNDIRVQIRAGLREGDVVLVKPVVQNRRTFEIR